MNLSEQLKKLKCGQMLVIPKRGFSRYPFIREVSEEKRLKNPPSKSIYIPKQKETEFRDFLPKNNSRQTNGRRYKFVKTNKPNKYGKTVIKMYHQ